ncbi:paerucumarin biosynthesis protein PvcA [Longimycelium tulufanense]|uniref:Paerucumarin biosynthesis protein PvcA n=1 Tax=Longimycelium tulufanense TaxID=907463 RepID=A0A8J3FUA7_9PSEU|nr:isocyanide synthase family protein [Longimycelium tulufanense]GGM56968.1 paerucumarin biosynthesis protein PvcA [Longimycelium tulufanense]
MPTPTFSSAGHQAEQRPAEDAQTCAAILDLLLPLRRAADPDTPNTPFAFPKQMQQLAAFVAAGEPILFTLPGFPCKSPNPAKVLGHLPDEAERQSLHFLDQMCAAVQQVYQPGASVVICSDGHVFSDIIGVPDEHVDAYSDELLDMIAREGLSRLSLFDLRNVLGDLSYDEKRHLVSERYAPTVTELREEVRMGGETLRLYRGITRFLVDDTDGWQGTKSALQRECRARAYQVVARSRAWGRLIAEHHPRSVRLSIHPQPAGSEKFGIRLLNPADTWTTPWHAVLVHREGEPGRLMRRVEAEALGEVVFVNGRPSYVKVLASVDDQSGSLNSAYAWF